MISTNNPGNLRPSSPPWLGEVTPRRGYGVFDTAEHGLRALAKQLIAYQDRHHCNTVCTIINRYAPPIENDTTSYIRDVCARMAVTQDQVLQLHNPGTLKALAVAIVWHENGAQPYHDAQLTAAVNDALA